MVSGVVKTVTENLRTLTDGMYLSLQNTDEARTSKPTKN